MKIKQQPNGVRYKIPESDSDKVPEFVIKKKLSLWKTMTGWIVIFLWVWFGIQFIVAPMLGYPPSESEWVNMFTLSAENISYYWTWVTSVFSHGGLFHLLINTIVFASFGRLMEVDVGKLGFALFFVLTGSIAGLTQVIVLYESPSGISSVLGASGAVSALIGYLTLTNPKQTVYLFFILKMNLKTASLLFIGGSTAVVILFGFGAGGIGHTAHITGFLLGIAYAKSKNL